MSRFLLLPLAVLALTGVLPSAPADEPPAKGANPFAGRTGATRAKLVKENGGNAESEKAVALGLAWLAKRQLKDGSWSFDGAKSGETAAATGFALLAFVGAGEHHKDAKAKHKDVVKTGVAWLAKNVTPNGAKAGKFTSAADMYGQGIATLALVEVYAVSKDAGLKAAAQSAVNFVVKSQGANGSWGYAAGTDGDTSIVGWQIQALTAAKHAGLAVDDKVLTKAVAFLDLVAVGKQQTAYGYKDKSGATPGSSLTAVGVWCRTAIDGWDSTTPGLIQAAEDLLKKAPAKQDFNLYRAYYATLVLKNAGGEAWQTWNEGKKDADGARKGGLRDVLVETQKLDGSWDPDREYIGQYCGRLGSTALSILQLEVYYRYASAEKKDEKDDAAKK